MAFYETNTALYATGSMMDGIIQEGDVAGGYCAETQSVIFFLTTFVPRLHSNMAPV